MMKKLFISLLAIAALASCSKSENEGSISPDRSGAIRLSANVQATTESRAAVVGTTFPASTNNVFRLTAFSGAAAPTTDWSATPYFNNIQVNSGAASALTFATAQYYPANGDKVYFYGYAPAATSLTAGGASAAPTANYTITGQEDIMAAQEVTGIAKATTGTQSQPALAFTHKLMQVQFKVVKDASYEAGKKVTEILVKGVKTSAKLNITTGVLAFDGIANQTLSLPITAGTKDEITAGGTEMDGCVMLEPVGTGGSVTLKVTADGVVYDNINVSLTGDKNGEAGTSHLITLTFKREEISPSATITDWGTPVDKDIDVDGDGWVPPPPPLPPQTPPSFGDYYYSDGSHSTVLDAGKTVAGIVYYIDAANPTKYKVVALTETIAKWSATIAYVLGTTGQSDADGKANVAAMKAYSLANTGNSDDTKKTTGVFATDFPAANFCDNINVGGMTGWYLPAKTDLQYLWCAFNGKAPVSWQMGTNNATAAADTGAQGVFNTYLTSAGGTKLSSVYIWSSTEYTDTKNAWYVAFGRGTTNGNSKVDNVNSTVRCIKSI